MTPVSGAHTPPEVATRDRVATGGRAAAVVVVEGTDPYPWPWTGDLDPARLALVLAGWDTHWSARTVGSPSAPRSYAGALVRVVADVGGLVVAVSHPRPPRAPSEVPDPRPLLVESRGATTLVSAGGIDGFCGSALDGVLREEGRSLLLVAGEGLEGPVHSTLRSANDRGYECLLVADACTHLTTDAAASAVASVTMSGGIFGAVGRTAPVLDALTLIADERTVPAGTDTGGR